MSKIVLPVAALLLATPALAAPPTLKSVCGKNRECIRQAYECVRGARAAEAKGWRSAAGYPVTLQNCLSDLNEDANGQ